MLRLALHIVLHSAPIVGAGLSLLLPPNAQAQSPARTATSSADEPVFLVYFWRARPGKLAEYSRYIREIAEPIDEAARKLGAFEEVKTYTPFLATGAPTSDWTHMRVFRLKNFAALDSFAVRIDSATKGLYPDGTARPTSTELRDLVRQEIWRGFR